MRVVGQPRSDHGATRRPAEIGSRATAAGSGHGLGRRLVRLVRLGSGGMEGRRGGPGGGLVGGPGGGPVACGCGLRSVADRCALLHSAADLVVIPSEVVDMRLGGRISRTVI
jgi:hypothetical protein